MIRIRDAVIDDLPAMLHIYNHAIRNLVATFDLEEQSLEQREIWFYKHGENYPLLVAESEGKIVGYSCLSTFREKPAYAQSTELSVYVADDVRGKGVGTALMAVILQRAAQLGYHTVISGIVGGNEASIALHQKFGFHFIGQFREVGFKFGEWQDVHFYQLLLENQ
ncbi:N-acetyltransferase [Brevibacillus reuszeri]|uniref:GNAT family acetyltransferase n=1 Tax=Brevibacillus reuszeri TaxID=54915 RepID=A0A0K9Z0U8_9BACL|nr:GNAT family N-acetyltransferase [Brevibacillus reuszeri]KNB74551.1 GNAT family acetyltransferase [Brevibacillus reuszeri]MED1856484.1 GNAT family N-acetyltransferase [Brevibacillus reuszeri]GED67818.1 N-acetyltransferase [Brevibacillus reuszeri]